LVRIIRGLFVGKAPKEQEERANRARYGGQQANYFGSGHVFPFTLSPSSTRRRMPSERVVSFFEAHSSTASTVEGGIRDETMVPRPVAGRPRFVFWSTFIDFFMN
jgi:hypothetical protein